AASRTSTRSSSSSSARPEPRVPPRDVAERAAPRRQGAGLSAVSIEDSPMTTALISGPAIEPVSLADVKANLKVDHGDDDGLLLAAIASARFHVEAATRRVLIEQHWRVYRDAWPRKRIVALPVAPLLSVDAVTIYDQNGDPVLVDPDDYEVDAVG